MSVEIVGTLLKPVANELSKKTIASVFDFLVNKYKLVEVSKFKRNYLEYCDKVLHVKTLISDDRVFHIDDIFVPVDLMQSGRKSKLEVNHTTALDNDRAILIKGLAGQGKSTLLRKLLANNAKRLNRLPIFYELKNYNGGAIELAISRSLGNSGVQISEVALKKIFSDSNVKLYLDAFDETKPEYRTELLDEIRRLVNAYKCHVVCTSRPDTEINTLSELETYSVCELTEKQIFGIIKKTASDCNKAIELCRALERSPLHTKKDSILKSPILVVLFCISYNRGEEIPSTLSQFYASIFDTVFHRHDNIKGKVSRDRHWNDNRRIYRDLFNCLCFISQRAGSNSFDKSKFIEFISVSLEHVDEDKALSDKVAKELSSITNLIIEDGFNEYRYVHKSIQEFFAASFIMSLNHPKKVAFYKKCFSDHLFHALFQNTLFFLEELDYYDYHEYGFIPSVRNVFSLSDKSKINDYHFPNVLTNLFLEKMIMRAKITVYKNNKNESVDIETTNFIFDDANEYPELYSRLFNFAIDYIKIELSNDVLRKLIKEGKEKSDDGWHNFSLRTVLKIQKIADKDALDSLKLGFDVLIRRKFDGAVDKLKNRIESLNKTSYFDF